jgi:hypothetical protein
MTKPTNTRQSAAEAERKPATSGQTHAEFLQSLREAHAGGRPLGYFRQWPVEYLVEAGLPDEWLRKCGLIQPDGTAAKLPNQCSQRQFAEIISKLYGKPINQAAVSRAIKDGLKVTVTPSNGRLRTDAALRWWETNRAGLGGSAVATEAEDKAARQRIARQREQLELDELERLQSGKWILLAEVEIIFAGEMRVFFNLARTIIEKNPPEAFEVFAKTLNLEPEKIAALKEFVRASGRKMIDAIADTGIKKSKELAKKLEKINSKPK